MPGLKKFLLLPLLIFSFTLAANSEALNDAAEIVKKANELKDDAKEEEALELYLEALDLDSENYDALWNASLLHASIGFRFDDEDRQKEYFETARDFAEKAIEAHPDSGHPYYVLSVAKGRLADVVGTQERIRLSHEIEDAVKKSIDIMPDYAPSWHLYGVWQSEVANLSRGERFAARFISRGLPEGSNEKAEEYLKNAEELDPESILIKLDLARHYIRVGEDEKAVPWLEKVLEMEPTMYDDPEHIEEAEKLLSEL